MDNFNENLSMDITNNNNVVNNNSDNKYSILENNHRRLLAVTSALTEALENTIRGDQFDMEGILNNCMRIYPELFTFSLKKPSPNTNFNKVYNTPDISDVDKAVSEEISKDYDLYPEGVCSKSAIFMGPEHNEKEIKGSHFNAIQPIRISGIPHHSTEPSQHANIVNIQSPRVFVEQPTPTFQRRPILEMNLQPNKENEDIIIKNLSDTSPYIVETPDVSDCSSSNYFDKTMKTTFKKQNEINEIKDFENSHHLTNNKNSTDYEKKLNHIHHREMEINISETIPPLNLNADFKPSSRKNSIDSQYSVDIRNQNVYQVIPNHNQKEREQHYSKPIEIIVQKKLQPDQNSPHGSEADVLIRIRPEAPLESKNVLNDSHDTEHNKNRRISTSSTMTQTLCRRPAETCIIITNQVDSNYFNHDDSSRHASLPTEDHNISPRMHREGEPLTFTKDNAIQEVIYDSLTETKHVTIEKLQKLSNALKIQADVMETPINKQKYMNDENTILNTTDLVFEKLDYLKSPLVEEKNNDRRNSVEFVIMKNDDSQITFDDIKNDLLNGTVKQKATVVQSLRLKLIHTLAKDRSRLVFSYTENDILSLSYNSTLLKKLLPTEIINGWDLILQEMTFKLLNTLSSMWKGRDYLSSNLRTLKCLQNYFVNKYSSKSPTDTVSIDMLIAIFHKLSTKPNQQILLVNSGVVEKILPNILENYDCMSSYRLRHSLGLMINLCVDEHAREVIQNMAEETIHSLSILLKSKDKKIVSYVVKFIYVLMANEVFHKMAKDKHLMTIIEELLIKSNKRMKLQLGVLKTIIEQMSPHQNFQNSEYSFLQNREAEVEELEEEVEHGEPYYLTGLNFEENRPADNKYRNKNETDDTQLAKQDKNEKSSTKTQNEKSKIIQKQVQKNVSKNIKVAEKKATKSNIPNPIKSKPSVKENKSANFVSIKSDDKTKSKTLGNNTSRVKDAQKEKTAVQHEIDEDFDPTVNDRILKEMLGKMIKDQSDQHNSNNITITNVQNHNDSFNNQDNIIINNPHNKTVEIDNKTSFIVLNNHKSNTFVNSDDIKIKENQQIQKGSPSSQSNTTTTSGSSNFSLFDKNKSYDQDYDYCEETKQIQTPIRFDNIFKDNRQSPYRGLVLESKRGNDNSSQTTTHRIDPIKNNYNILENESSTTSTE